LRLAAPFWLVVPVLAGIGGLVLAIVMAGAIVAHILVLGGSALPAVVLLAATLTIAWQRRAQQRPSLVRA
jgi:putative oxidoreductase